MNGWLIEKCVHTVNPHFQDDLVIADQLVCWLGTFVFCILCLILSILTDLFDCFDDECELFCWDVFVMTPSFWLQKLYQHHTMYSRWKWSMKIKCPCLLHGDQLSLLEDSKSPHIAHIRGLLVKLLSQLSEWGIRLQFKEEQRSSKKSLSNVCIGLVWSNKPFSILYQTPTHTDINSAEELPWMFSSCSSKWSRWRWSRCRRHSWSSSLASKPWKIWT